MRCRICGNQGGKTHKVKEMMFGFRDEFEYLECPSCGCLQIASIVPDIGKYYPPSKYYSFNSPKLNPLFNWVMKERDRWTLLRRGYVGMFLARGRPDRLLGEISALGVTEDQKVLDVGCGDGFLLRRMRGAGFKRLTGIDPYLREEVAEGGFRLLRRDIFQLGGERFDLVMLHHSLEHMERQLEVMKKIRELLADMGRAMIRIPVKSEHIWRRYGVHWVQIDAPRHFYLHTLRSFSHLTRAAGLEIEKTAFDSTDFQFWGSELYKMNIPLVEGNPYTTRLGRRLFTRRKLREYRSRAEYLNSVAQGDAACFILKKPTS